MRLTSNHMFVLANFWDKSPSWFQKKLKLPLFYSGNFKFFKNALGQFIPNRPSNHVISTNSISDKNSRSNSNSISNSNSNLLIIWARIVIRLLITIWDQTVIQLLIVIRPLITIRHWSFDPGNEGHIYLIKEWP